MAIYRELDESEIKLAIAAYCDDQDGFEADGPIILNITKGFDSPRDSTPPSVSAKVKLKKKYAKSSYSNEKD